MTNAEIKGGGPSLFIKKHIDDPPGFRYHKSLTVFLSYNNISIVIELIYDAQLLFRLLISSLVLELWWWWWCHESVSGGTSSSSSTRPEAVKLACLMGRVSNSMCTVKCFGQFCKFWVLELLGYRESNPISSYDPYQAPHPSKHPSLKSFGQMLSGLVFWGRIV